ncbi:MAG: MaoC/PaaZ C-terminal domain-containing protein [Lysobacterales bacterium]
MQPTQYLEDLQTGEIRRSRLTTVSQKDIVNFASQWDPQYFHADPQAAQNHAFGEIAASGIHILALWRQLDHEISGNVRWICGVSWESLRWANPLHAEQPFRAHWEVLEKRYSSKPGRGVLTLTYALLRDDDEPLFTCRAVSLVEARGTPEPS